MSLGQVHSMLHLAARSESYVAHGTCTGLATCSNVMQRILCKLLTEACLLHLLMSTAARHLQPQLLAKYSVLTHKTCTRATAS